HAREEIARTLGASANEIVFTGGGSEADNLAIFGVTRALRSRGQHVITAATEHHAVVHSFHQLRDDGFEVTVLGVNDDGVVDAAEFDAALTPGTIFASIMLANNEIGSIQPVAQLSAMARAKDVIFHTDAVQAPSFLAIDVRALGVDLLSLSAHKFYGPKGVGLLYVRAGTPVAPLILGGSQEFSKRAGTENVSGIVGMARALTLAATERDAHAARVAALRDRFEEQLTARVSDIRINGKGAQRLPNNSNISFAGIPADAMVMRLDLEGAAVSTGSACASGALEPSHVIEALGIDARWRTSAVRFSFGRATTQAQIDRLAALVERVAGELRTFSSKGA
ncbi:MAG: cysteine desulfurase, partial [Candidatus Eremiobacteraeota bacterium]|nr:cysteine desulfurase [Candidatus Eremiobacteraeota bacterium]